MIALTVFFVIVVVCFGLLFGANFIANKFLDGYFMQEGHGDDDLSSSDEEYSENKSSPYKEFTYTEALEEIKEIGFENTFASKAKVTLILQYISNRRCILGNLKTIDGLKTRNVDAPHEICFHVKITPKSKYHAQTKSKPISSKILASSFTLGPIKEDDFTTWRISFRLYGRMKKMGAMYKCYGEFFVAISEIAGRNDSVQFEKFFLPKANNYF